MKRRVPINEKMASRMSGEQTLYSHVEETRTVFSNSEGIPIFERIEIKSPWNEYGLVSYFAFIEELKREGD